MEVEQPCGDPAITHVHGAADPASARCSPERPGENVYRTRWARMTARRHVDGGELAPGGELGRREGPGTERDHNRRELLKEEGSAERDRRSSTCSDLRIKAARSHTIPKLGISAGFAACKRDL